jgi:hypothetical protein
MTVKMTANGNVLEDAMVVLEPVKAVVRDLVKEIVRDLVKGVAAVPVVPAVPDAPDVLVVPAALAHVLLPVWPTAPRTV